MPEQPWTGGSYAILQELFRNFLSQNKYFPCGHVHCFSLARAQNNAILDEWPPGSKETFLFYWSSSLDSITDWLTDRPTEGDECKDDLRMGSCMLNICCESSLWKWQRASEESKMENFGSFCFVPKRSQRKTEDSRRDEGTMCTLNH